MSGTQFGVFVGSEEIVENRLDAIFEDGRSGVVDFTRFVRKGGVFARLADLEFFKEFRINEELGVITWGEEIDIAPEILYSAATQEPLPHWMQEDIEMREMA